MREQCIAFTAHKIYENGNQHKSNEEIWQMAENKLSIFPDEVKQIAPSVYGLMSTSDGCFGLRSVAEPETTSWEKCRELFETSMQTGKNSMQNCGALFTKGFYFSVYRETGGFGEKIAHYIRMIEEVLNLTNLSTFKKTSLDGVDKPNCIWIEPSDFWTQYSMRMSALTMFLRCGVIHKDFHHYHEALETYTYARDTILAVDRFLAGYTVYTAHHDWMNRRNWYYAFQSKTASQIAELLVKP
jgi:hypothetical protein